MSFGLCRLGLRVIVGLACCNAANTASAATEPDVCKRETYGRGVGKPVSACASGQQRSGALCYPECKTDYRGVGPVCWEKCREGYTDDGATCRRDAHIYKKGSYGRGVGKPMPCKKDQEKDAGLCYKKCKEGYKGVGPVCWERGCKEGYKDDGGTCRRDVHIYGKESYGRGVGESLGCPAGQDRDAGLCYQPCRTGYAGAGPVCWETCPAGYRNDGAFCTKGGQVTASKGYGRGVGTIPP